MLPCKKTHSLQQQQHTRRRHLLSEDSQHCEKGKVPLMSLEALHHLQIFIFVLGVVHVLFCATTMVLGGSRIRQWKRWEVWIRDQSKVGKQQQQRIVVVVMLDVITTMNSSNITMSSWNNMQAGSSSHFLDSM